MCLDIGLVKTSFQLSPIQKFLIQNISFVLTISSSSSDNIKFSFKKLLRLYSNLVPFRKLLAYTIVFFYFYGNEYIRTCKCSVQAIS
jgi:hypothetical protein